MKKYLVALFALSYSTISIAQYKSTLPANQWVDSVFNTLSNEEKIAQMMIIRAHSNLGPKHIQEVTELVRKYNVGGLCFFQGGPIRQANLTNFYQSIAKTPLMISIDGEWGLGMRLDSVINFPRQLMIGAVPDAQMVYQFGRAVGEQCKRIGIHVNFAPDVDVNNNPNNPVINDRSFGEDKYKVALYGIQYMKGMQDVGVMACAKHFPGHGDVDVDSHYDLPVINKTRAQLDSLELYPFRQILNAGVGSVMVAHLYIPSIDKTPNQATSLSYANVTTLLRKELNYQGLTFTDALDMKGVAKFYPAGEASVQSLIAGNDMLCLPGDIPGSISKTLKAIKKGKLAWTDINARVKKVLLAKYSLGLNSFTPIQTEGITEDLNAKTKEINAMLAANALTLLKQADPSLLPINKKKIAYLAVGLDSMNTIARQAKNELKADVYLFNYRRDMGGVNMLAATLKKKYDMVIVGLHNYSRRPANNYGLSASSIALVNEVQATMPTVTLVFGNPYAIRNISATATNMVACYEDNETTQRAAVELLKGKLSPKGKLPVTVNEQLKFGTGLTSNFFFQAVAPEAVSLQSSSLAVIDSIANDAIANKAAPGCVVLVAKDGQIAYYKSYGYTNYDSAKPVNLETIYDLASVTKITATTVAVMRLYEQGRLELNKTLGDYLPWVKGSDKESLTVEKILLHQAGLVSWIPFFRETLDSAGNPRAELYRATASDSFAVRVAENLYIRNDWRDTMYKRILNSKLGPQDKYVYSDNDFIFLGEIVQAITKQPFEQYVRDSFYIPLGMTTTTFLPRDHFTLELIAPTEREKHFRQQLLLGDVHDPGAAMFGGVAGHAGLFSNAYDLAILYQMLLNGGEFNGQRFFKKETIDLFTKYSSTLSRRGLGFDKPEKDNATRKDPYPTLSASSETFGHTGFTGTCVWADPKQNLLYIFLSNRVTPDGGDNTKLLRMNVRSNIHEAIYKAIVPATLQVKNEVRK